MASPATTFTRFGLLAPEIRLQIWKEITPGLRTVPVRYDKETCTWKSRILPPTVLQINQESRLEGLKKYHELRLGPLTVTGCYVDLSIDTLFFRSNVISEMDEIEDSTILGDAPRGQMAHPPPRGSLRDFSQPAPNPQDISKQDIETLLPGFIPTYHSAVILDDLLKSPDANHILNSLHLDMTLWRVIYSLHRYHRHQLPNRINEFAIVYERGDGPLTGDLQIQTIYPPLDEALLHSPPYQKENDTALKLVHSYAAQHALTNRKDSHKHLPPVLTRNISLKTLVRRA